MATQTVNCTDYCMNSYQRHWIKSERYVMESGEYQYKYFYYYDETGQLGKYVQDEAHSRMTNDLNGLPLLTTGNSWDAFSKIPIPYKWNMVFNNTPDLGLLEQTNFNRYEFVLLPKPLSSYGRNLDNEDLHKNGSPWCRVVNINGNLVDGYVCECDVHLSPNNVVRCDDIPSELLIDMGLSGSPSVIGLW